MDFPEFLSYLPTLRSQNYDPVLASTAVQEMRDSHSHYYFQIDAVRREGEPIPLERLRGTIRRILFNQRQSEIIRSHEEELYNRACEGGSIKIFENEQIDSCINFAGLKAVGESVAKPWEYYNNNIAGTLTLVDVMRQHNCKNIIFSSSATVYGDPAEIPITENCPKGQCTNPYGWTKSMLEQILTDIQKADPEWNVILLRYFNPQIGRASCRERV